MLTRKKTIVWCFIVLVICGWMFVLGVLVGRGTAPVNFDVKKLKNDIVSELTAAIEKEKEEKKAQIDVSMNTPVHSDKQDLGFYEDLKSTKELPEHINIKEVPKPEAVSLPAPVPVESSVKEPEPEKTGEKVIAKESVPAKTEEKIVAKEPPLPKKTTGPVFTIQLASGRDEKYADKMVGELIKKGYQAYRSSGEIKGKGIWHRVRVGEFGDRAGAGTILNKLKKDKFNGIIVTR
uniref:SPOR domain-containing protein n=1 Tax=uncultured Desulfobacterium sp. TaxID=201089 RepID=E1YFN2_9BACT|nr:hypothetical protein N47_J03570 [uncultured Desulfobacterium sp.]